MFPSNNKLITTNMNNTFTRTVHQNCYKTAEKLNYKVELSINLFCFPETLIIYIYISKVGDLWSVKHSNQVFVEATFVSVEAKETQVKSSKAKAIGEDFSSFKSLPAMKIKQCISYKCCIKFFFYMMWHIHIKSLFIFYFVAIFLS